LGQDRHGRGRDFGKRVELNRKTRTAARQIGVPPKDLAQLIIAADNPNQKIAKFASVQLAKLIGRLDHDDALNAPLQVTADTKTAAPSDPPAGGDAGGGAPPAAGGDPAAAADPGAPLGDAGLGDVAGVDPMADPGADPMGGGMPPMGGGGGGGMSVSPDMAGGVQQAIAMGVSVTKQRELMELKHFLRLLERKKELLEELKEMREKKHEEMELFTHVTNKDYDGPDKIQILPPEQIEISNEGTMEQGPTIYYKPPEAQKQAYLEDPDVPAEVKEKIQLEGKIPLNQDPMKGSYVIHFARKKSGYELHGRSILQRCIRTVIYREKLRQVQSTLASRNMTPKTLVIAPGIPSSRSHGAACSHRRSQV
jgi:hypothetical protein